MKDIKILIDMDNTINDFTSQFNEYLKKYYSTELDYSVFEKTYHIEKAIKLDILNNKKQEILEEIFAMDDFWLTIPLIDNYVYKVVKEIYERYDTYIATSPWRYTKKYKLSKIEWIKGNMPFIDTSKIIFSSDKWKLHGDIIIDDKSEVIENCKKNGFITIMSIHTYNKNTKADYSFKKWNEVLTILKEIEDKRV